MNEEKHDIPFLCRLRVSILGGSPSAVFNCSIGTKNTYKKCKNCRANFSEIMMKGFKEGLERGYKNDERI